MSRNNWTNIEMETVLYFYLLNRESISSLSKKDDKFRELVCRINYVAKNKRTIDSVYMRVQNYKYIDPLYKGKGLKGGANQCQIYWDKYIANTAGLKEKYDEFIENSNDATSSEYIPESKGINKWTDIEMIVCLYLYLNYSSEILHKNSKLLQSVLSRMNLITGNNRTIDSIIMRIQNYKYIDLDAKEAGLSGGEKLCKMYWDKYINNQSELQRVFYEKIINNHDKDDEIELEKNVEEIMCEVECDEFIDKDAYVESIINLRNPSFQKHFKDKLNVEFDSKCAICGLDIPELLVASHILPYSKCSEKKSMIDHNNGLLLCSIHDALFDKKIISFDVNGRIVISRSIKPKTWELLGIDEDYFIPQKYMNRERKKYFEEHMKLFKEKENEKTGGF